MIPRSAPGGFWRCPGAWPVRVDQRALANPDRWVQSACVLCSNGCALDIAVKDGRIVGVRGREQDAVNRGRLGPKGLHGWEANNSRDRLTMPLTKSGGALQQASWNDAMSLIVERTKEIRDRATASAGAGCGCGTNKPVTFSLRDQTIH